MSSVDYSTKIKKYNAKFNNLYWKLNDYDWPAYLIRQAVANSYYTLPPQPRIILAPSAVNKINNMYNTNNNPLATQKDNIVDLMRSSRISSGYFNSGGNHYYTVFEFENNNDAEKFSQYLSDYDILDHKREVLKVNNDGKHYYVALDIIDMLQLITVLIGSPVSLDQVKKVDNDRGEIYRAIPSESKGDNFPKLERPTNPEVIRYVTKTDTDGSPSSGRLHSYSIRYHPWTR